MENTETSTGNLTPEVVASVKESLERVLGSKPFLGSDRLRRFLRFIVEKSLSGQTDSIKEYVLGLEVFDKGPSFDPRIDPIVRVDASRLRSKLREYYEIEGKEDPVRIDLPKGNYVPVFRLVNDRELPSTRVAEGVGSTKESAAKTASHVSNWLWLLVGLGLAGILYGGYLFRTDRKLVPTSSVRFTIAPPEKTAFEDDIALSPDGRLLAFSALRAKDQNSLWVRSLDSLVARELSGTDGARQPFWSPDSEWIGFVAHGKLRKIKASGGAVHVLADVGYFLGGTWNRDGVIVYSRSIEDPLFQTRPDDGKPRPLTTIDRSLNEAHYSPFFLPDGNHFLFTAFNAAEVHHTESRGGLYVSSLSNPGQRQLVGSMVGAVFAPSGHLIYNRDGSLVAQSFDVTRHKVFGGAQVVAEQVPIRHYWYPSFSVTHTRLAFMSHLPEFSQLAWYDRSGKQLDLLGFPGIYMDPQLSPDNSQIAVSTGQSDRNKCDIWLLKASQGGLSRLTFFATSPLTPIWSPDGRQIAFAHGKDGYAQLFEKLVDGSREEQLLLKTQTTKHASDWSSDGQSLIYGDWAPSTKMDIWVLPLSGTKEPFTYLRTPAHEGQAKLSPNGRWMAYTSNESGKDQVYVQSFPQARGKWLISGEE